MRVPGNVIYVSYFRQPVYYNILRAIFIHLVHSYPVPDCKRVRHLNTSHRWLPGGVTSLFRVGYAARPVTEEETKTQEDEPPVVSDSDTIPDIPEYFELPMVKCLQITRPKNARHSRVILVSTLTRRREWCAASMVKPSKMCKRQLPRWKTVVRIPSTSCWRRPTRATARVALRHRQHRRCALSRGATTGCLSSARVPWKPPSLTLRPRPGLSNKHAALSQHDRFSPELEPGVECIFDFSRRREFFCRTRTYGSIRTSVRGRNSWRRSLSHSI